MREIGLDERVPRTEALRRVVSGASDTPTLADLLFLEAWERDPGGQLGSVFRANQIRRANPELAAEIRAELARGRPLTPTERDALLHPPALRHTHRSSSRRG